MSTATPIRITDPADARLADYTALTDAELRKRYEREAGVLIAEGPNPLRELVASPYPVRSVLLDEDRIDAVADVLADIDAPVYVTTRELLYRIVRFRLHQGVLACGGRLPPPAVDRLLTVARRVVVLEAANDHENLGVLFRSARALGADAVLLGPSCADPLYRRTVRVSMGHVLRLPYAWLPSIGAGFDALTAAGFQTLAFTPADDAVDVTTVQPPPDARIAVLLGAEGPGLSAEALERADVRVRIPMRPTVDSINVAMAAGIAFHALGWGQAASVSPHDGAYEVPAAGSDAGPRGGRSAR